MVGVSEGVAVGDSVGVAFLAIALGPVVSSNKVGVIVGVRVAVGMKVGVIVEVAVGVFPTYTETMLLASLSKIVGTITKATTR
jgi:hypothetical protein